MRQRRDMGLWTCPILERKLAKIDRKALEMKNQPLEIWKLTRRSAVSAAHIRIRTEEDWRAEVGEQRKKSHELWQKSRADRRETSDIEHKNASDLGWELYKLGPQKSLKKAGFQDQAWLLSFLDC